MRLALLFALSALACAVTSSAEPSKRVVFATIPLPGHIIPLGVHAGEMAVRGWDVSIATLSTGVHFTHSFLADNGFKGVKVIDLGACDARDFIKDLVPILTSSHSFGEDITTIFKWTMELYPCLYKGLMQVLTHPETRPDVLVVDHATSAALDAGDDANVTTVVQNSCMMSLMPPGTLAPVFYNPPALTGVPGLSLGYNNLLIRTTYPLVKQLLKGLGYFLHEIPLNAVRAQSGARTTRPFWNFFDGKMVIMSNHFGFEYPRPVSPLHQMVGYVGVESPLSEEDKNWVEADHRPVILISMGTLARLNSRQVEALLVGLNSTEWRLVWKTTPAERALLESFGETPATFEARGWRMVTWVSSLPGLLAHPQTRLFVSHGGVNSVLESVRYQTPVLCVPMFADQIDSAVRLVDSGAGVYLDKHTFTAQQVREGAIKLMTDDRVHSVILPKLSASLKLGGGTKRAADLIEHAAQFGVSHLQEAYLKYPWYAAYDLDVYAIWLVVSFIVFRAFGLCCACLCCCCRSKKTVAPKVKLG